jgi:hypothetical protein
MTPLELQDLAHRVAAATGLQPAEAQAALESGDPSLVDLARRLVALDATRDEWQSALARHRRNIVAAAA